MDLEYNNKISRFEEISDRLEDLILQFPDQKREEIVFDRWSLKNVVSHLNHWMIHDIDCLTSLQNGKVPHWEEDVEMFNSKGVEKRSELSWDTVFSEFRLLRERLISLYSSLDSKLLDKKIWPDKRETPRKFLDEDINHWQNEHVIALENYLKR